MRLAWGARVSSLFVERTLAMCVRLGVEDPSHMMACIAFETGRKFTSDVKNAVSGATGLIQFMPSTARAMGTTVEYLATLSPEDQLEWVEKYFRDHQRMAGRMHGLDDVYMAILWPKAVGKLLNSPLFSADDLNSRAYVQNKGLDVDLDGVVTKGEATAYVQKALDEGLQFGNWIEVSTGAHVDTTVQPEPIPTLTDVVIPPIAPDLPRSQPSPETPMLPALLATLLPQILNGFSPAGQAQAKPVLGQPMEQLAPLLLNLFTMFGQKTGVLSADQPITTEAQAIAATAEFNRLKETNASLVAEIEQGTLNRLKIIAPMVDKLLEADRERNAAVIAGRESARLAQQSDTTGSVPVLVKHATRQSSAIIGGLLVTTVTAIVAKGYWPQMPDYINALIALLGMAVGTSLNDIKAIVAYFFDGTPSSNAAEAINAEMNATRRKA